LVAWKLQSTFVSLTCFFFFLLNLVRSNADFFFPPCFTESQRFWGEKSRAAFQTRRRFIKKLVACKRCGWLSPLACICCKDVCIASNALALRRNKTFGIVKPLLSMFNSQLRCRCAHYCLHALSLWSEHCETRSQRSREPTLANKTLAVILNYSSHLNGANLTRLISIIRLMLLTILLNCKSVEHFSNLESSARMLCFPFVKILHWAYGELI
jgi:hypothetical protein